MKHVNRCLFLGLFSFVFIGKHVVFAQDTIQTRYYIEPNDRREVPLKKAKFAECVIKLGDTAESTVMFRLADQVILNSSTYCGEEPCGEWVTSYNEKKYILNYDFSLNYTDTSCNTNSLALKITDSNDSLHYKAPTLSLRGKKIDFYEYLGNVIEYPLKAKKMREEGKVFAMVRVSSEGIVSSVGIIKASSVEFAKEVARVFREMKFDTSPMLNGITQEMCYIVPVKFKLY